MYRKLICSLTIAITLFFGVSLISPSSVMADEKNNPSDCAKIRDIDEKMECHKKALETLKAGEKNHDKDDDDKDEKNNKSKKDKKKKGKKK